MIKAVLFDIYGTLLQIRTDEFDPRAYQLLSSYLEYKHIYLSPDHLDQLYHEEFSRRLGPEPSRPASLDEFRQYVAAHPGAYPDADMRDVFKSILRRCCDITPENEELNRLAADLSHLFRASTRRHLSARPEVRGGLAALREKFRLGIVSNAQEAFTPAELDIFGLRQHFDPVILSSQTKLKKPNPAIFRAALEKVGVAPAEAVFVGNDLLSDVMGAGSLGMRTILIGRPSFSIAGVAPSAVIPELSPVEVLRIIESWHLK